MPINCDIWLQVQATDLDAYSLTVWKYLKSSDSQMQTFHEWQDFCTHFITAAKKKKEKRRRRYFFVFKEKSLKPFLVRVKHGRRFQNTNYNWVVSLNLLKALVWLIFPPSNSCCWSECQPLNWLRFTFPKKAYKGFQLMWEHTDDFLQDNVTNKIALLPVSTTLADSFTEQKWTLAVFCLSYCGLCNPHCFKEWFA